MLTIGVMYGIVFLIKQRPRGTLPKFNSTRRAADGQTFPICEQQAEKNNFICHYSLLALGLRASSNVHAHYRTWDMGASGDERVAGYRLPRYERHPYALPDLGIS